MHEISEINLIEAAASGDIDSFGKLCGRYYSAMVAISYSILSDHQLAEDSAQETFARALVNLKKMKNQNKFAQWLAAICRNVAKDMLSEKSTRLDKEAFSQRVQNTNDKNMHINQAIEKLPNAMKELVVLRYYDGLSYDQISSVLGISKASINGRLTRAKRKMANYLRKMDLSENQL
ncbi:MAG: RNA polymerase sigma factor [Sedimentisphaerales bacterium]|nr:RNA polymerase sigma factor [Sedimentisphaerales bacterium]